MKPDYKSIRVGIENLRKQLPWGACASQTSFEANCKDEAYKEVLNLLDILETVKPKRIDWKALGKAVLLVTVLVSFMLGGMYLAQFHPALLIALAFVGAVIAFYHMITH